MTSNNVNTSICTLISRLSNDVGILNYSFTQEQIQNIELQFKKGFDHESALFQFNDMELMPPSDLMTDVGLAIMAYMENHSDECDKDAFYNLQQFYQNLKILLSYIQKNIYNYDVTKAMYEAMEEN